ncbi:hypothetical protein [Microvirga calopogonii]|uniref:hypothetical protein n=1 Tax=Microvirga calopogonii TaxID=2078013 RepID=UPI000E0CFB82|nr:hypothetical protein [Microvirga calopogonii]
MGSLFAKRPLILGEDQAAYDALLSTVTRAAKPDDILDELLVKDIVDLTWNIERFERLKDSLLRVASKRVLTRVLHNAKCPETERPLDAERIELMIVCCLLGEEDSIEEVKDLLTDYGFDLNSIMAQALSDKLDDIERIDRSITTQAARRSKVLAELERRQELKAWRLGGSVVDVVDASAQPVLATMPART